MATVADALTGKSIMEQDDIIAHSVFHIVGSEDMSFRLFRPQFLPEENAWGCRYEFGAPFNHAQTIYGENSLQALLLALKISAALLYASDLYKQQKIGVFGEIGGQLIFPAPDGFLDIAPYPF